MPRYASLRNLRDLLVLRRIDNSQRRITFVGDQQPTPSRRNGRVAGRRGENPQNPSYRQHEPALTASHASADAFYLSRHISRTQYHKGHRYI